MGAPAPRMLLGLGLVTACALAFQVLLTRLLSAVLAYHFSFLAVSLSLVGTGAGAMLLYLRPDRFRAPVASLLASWTVLFAVALVAVPVAAAQLDLATTAARWWSLRFALMSLVAAVPPFAAGVVVALALSRYVERVGLVYGVDLFGAGVGAFVAVPLMWSAPAPVLVVALAAVAAAAAVSFAGKGALGGAALAVSVALSVLVLHQAFSILDLGSGYELPADAEVHERWTPLARVLGVHDPSSETFAMVLYDRVYAPVPIVAPDRELTWRELQTGLQSIPYRFAGPGLALVVGGGGGRDIHTALSEEQYPVDVIELNEGIRQVVDEDLARISGSPYSLPGVDTVVGDGRSTLAARRQLYDQIHLGFTDTLSANAAQGFALMENNLYTVEAFQEYFEHLKPEGILAVSRLYDFVGPEVLRLTVLAMASLRARGIEQPRDHVFVMRGTELGGAGMGTLLARLTPFSGQDLNRLRFLAKLRGGEVVFAPDGAGSDEWNELAQSASEHAFCAAQPLDVCPPTDDRPFFFNMQRSGAEVGGRPAFWRGLNPYSMLWTALGILVALCLVAFVLPLASSRASLPPARWSLYFAAIGLGYILVEIVLIQHFVLFLGFPTYALSVVLAGLLVSSGFGALASRRLTASNGLLIALLLAVFLIVAGAVGVQPVLRAMIDRPLASRVGFALILLAPLGALLGTAMPIGLRRLEELQQGAVPYAWGINGLTSVLGSVAGVLIAMQAGFAATGLVAAGCYAVALASAATDGRRT